MSRDCAKVAATLMRHLCDHDWHGYTQGSGRWGDGEGVCTVDVDGETFSLMQGDRDCSSAVISCWQEALRGTSYEGVLDNATYTGNMRSVFSNSGLFEIWDTYSSSAQRGDIYLNDESHTAMCVDDGSGDLGYDALAEFCISENGTIYGEVGDQTGYESYVHEYYSFPWDCTLHYNGLADNNTEEDDEMIDYDVLADKVAERVWNFEQNGVAMRNRMQGTDEASNKCLEQLTRKDDPSGRGTVANAFERACWLGADTKAIKSNTEKILSTLTNPDK